MRAADSAEGTAIFAPSSFQPLPSFVAVVVGCAGSSFASSWSAAVRIVVPVATPGSHAFFCAAVPNSAIGSAPSTSEASTGTCATVRPTSSQRMPSSTSPSPEPPRSSGTAAEEARCASAFHVAASCHSPAALSAFRRSSVTWSEKIFCASSRSASWSWEKLKSIVSPEGALTRTLSLPPCAPRLRRGAPMGASAPVGAYASLRPPSSSRCRVHRARGMPRPAIAMISRCTSFVPPPKVRIGAWPR